MCLMAFALHPDPALGLLLASNRDESLDRPTQPLHQWHTQAGTPVWAGRDVREGGTWLGCTPHGRLGMLTNVRDPDSIATATGSTAPTPPRSRGELVTRWLDTSRTEPDARRAAAELLAWLGPRALEYGGFNLVVGDVAQGHWLWLNNRPDLVLPGLPATLQALVQRTHPHLLAATLPPGVYGLSNAGLDTPWPKTRALIQALAQSLQPDLASLAVGEPPPALADSALWHTLASAEQAPDDQLPHTGVPWVWEQALSAIWVDVLPHGRAHTLGAAAPSAATGGTARPAASTASGYGTRSSLLMRVFRPNGQPQETAAGTQAESATEGATASVAPTATTATATTPPSPPSTNCTTAAPGGEWQVQMLERTWRPADQAGWVSAGWAFPAQAMNQLR